MNNENGQIYQMGLDELENCIVLVKMAIEKNKDETKRLRKGLRTWELMLADLEALRKSAR